MGRGTDSKIGKLEKIERAKKNNELLGELSQKADSLAADQVIRNEKNQESHSSNFDHNGKTKINMDFHKELGSPMPPKRSGNHEAEYDPGLFNARGNSENLIFSSSSNPQEQANVADADAAEANEVRLTNI